MSGGSRPRPEGTGVADSDDSSAGTDGVREDRFRRWRHLSIRARLTATYAGLVTISGTVLIILVYFYTRYITLSIAFGPPQQVPAIDLTTPQVAQVDTNLFELLGAILRSAVGALLLLAVVSGTVGWVLAGRMLRPLSSMNAAAKRAASGDLSQRLALSGPRDEIHDLADTFDTMLASLERSFSVHRRFAANASHELRTPLATAQTMIDVTLADPDASAQQLRSLAQRLRETNRANVETVDALLDLAEAQSGDLYREEVDLAEVVGAALAQLAPEAGSREVALPGPPDGPVVVEGDPVLLRQAVSNLLRNAVRHNVPGGAVEMSLARAGGRTRLRLSNGGPVVPAERLESLREPFVRGSGRGRTRGAGHGLGLALVSAVAEAHDGALELSANPSGGLTAVLDLPVHAGGDPRVQSAGVT